MNRRRFWSARRVGAPARRLSRGWRRRGRRPRRTCRSRTSARPPSCSSRTSTPRPSRLRTLTEAQARDAETGPAAAARHVRRSPTSSGARETAARRRTSSSVWPATRVPERSPRPSQTGLGVLRALLGAYQTALRRSQPSYRVLTRASLRASGSRSVLSTRPAAGASRFPSHGARGREHALERYLG